jgi:predicted alpha/beta-hydrolase family hydrolase
MADRVNAPTIVLAHGAGAGKDHPWMRQVSHALTAAGIRVVTFNFPYIDAKRSAPDRPAVLEARFVDVWKEAAADARGPMFAGGKSMGGRIASQVASRGGFDPPAAGLVFFGYPLHPPGKPDQRRDAHLPSVAVPMLFLHGTCDPFGSPEEMQALTSSLGGRARLQIVDGGDHSLVAPKRTDPQSLQNAIAVAVEWITQLAAR